MRSQVAEGLVRADGVVVRRSALNRPVKLRRRVEGKDEKAQAALGASLFEVGGEFAAAVDLQGADGKGMRCWRVSRN